MSDPYKIRILEAKYDQENKMLVLFSLFEHSGERKMLVLSKDDISHMFFRRDDIGDQNMHYFARCLSQRESPLRLVIEDDPNRKQLSEEDMMKHAMMFNKTITNELEQVKEGLADSEGQMQRKLGGMMKDGKIKLDAVELLKRENSLRNKIGE